MVRNPTGLDAGADRAFQEKIWVAVRVGWVAMLGLFVAALLGFSGSGGPFSSQVLRTDTGRIELPAVTRWAAADSMSVQVNDPAETIRVTVPSEFGQIFAVESVHPQPTEVKATADGVVFSFAREGRPRRTSIDFQVRASKPWRRQSLGAFVIDGARSKPSSVTVLP